MSQNAVHICIFWYSKICLKQLEIMSQSAVHICISWYSKICWFPVKKCWRQQNSRGVSRDSYIFCIFFRKGITVLSFILVGYVWQILRSSGKWSDSRHFSKSQGKFFLSFLYSLFSYFLDLKNYELRPLRSDPGSLHFPLLSFFYINSFWTFF